MNAHPPLVARRNGATQVPEQAEALDTHVCIGVGTPNRVAKLVESAALGLERVRLVILDMQVRERVEFRRSNCFFFRTAV